MFQETEVVLGCQTLFKNKRPDDLASNNTAPNANRKVALKMCFCGCMKIIMSLENARIFVTIDFRTYT